MSLFVILFLSSLVNLSFSAPPVPITQAAKCATELDLEKAWKISTQGVGRLNDALHEMRTALLYYGTAILAKENVLIDGPGGGAKTFSIRKFFEAELARIRSLPQAEKDKALKEVRVFVTQFNEMMSEVPILGGPNPFKIVKEGDYDIDYEHALIAPQNWFAILDELEKAPPEIQMTLLSILNERQALQGNKIVQTLLKSIAATTNATLGELIAQADPHEVGGRMALIDRFAVKLHLTNVDRSAKSQYLFLLRADRLEDARTIKDFFMIDLSGVQSLLDKIEIPQELLMRSAVDIALHMDRFYTGKLTQAIQEVDGTKVPAKYYPPFSGSTRAQVKVVPLWKAAFLMHQILDGVPFDQLRLKMEPHDLIDLNVALLQGGPDFFVPDGAKEVRFIYNQGADPQFSLFISNVDIKELRELNLSLGFFDPETLIFTYRDKNDEVQVIRFDPVKQVLLYPNEKVRIELEIDRNHAEFKMLKKEAKELDPLPVQLAKILAEHKKAKNKSSTPPPSFTTSKYVEQFLAQASLRTGGRDQLEEIQRAHSEFLSAVNSEITKLHGQPLTSMSDVAKRLKEANQNLEDEIEAFNEKLDKVLKTGSKRDLTLAAIESFRLTYKELVSQFKSSASDLLVILGSIGISGTNVMLFGGPGSAKTLKARLLIDAALRGLSAAQVKNINSELANLLFKAHRLTSESNVSSFLKQFHPLSSEQDVVGRKDFRALWAGEGHKYKYEGTLADQDVFFALLDEFEKAPPGVRTALLSLLYERQVFSGYEVMMSNIISLLISTNSTPSEFLTSFGVFSTAFPIYDRIQRKTFVFNKLNPDELRDLYARVYFGLNPKLKSNLFFTPLKDLAEKFRFNSGDMGIEEFLSNIHFHLMKRLVDESEAERSVHRKDPIAAPVYFIGTRGESRRSVLAALKKELKSEVLVNRLILGGDLEALVDRGFEFRLSDLESFANLYLTANPFIRVRYRVRPDGQPEVYVEEIDSELIRERMPPRDQKTIEYIRREAEAVAQTINTELIKYYESKKQLILEYPSLFPSLFVDQKTRVDWLRKQGISEGEIEKHYGKQKR